MSTAPMGPTELADKAGQEIGVSSWIEVGQQRIDEFAHCTEDRQWIHVDVERAAKESPAGGTIAHGYLVLALLAPTGMEILVPRVRAKQILNYGLDKVRFPAPVLAGKRVRNRFRFLEAHDMTIEAVVTKSMWLLAQNCESFDQLQQRFYRQVNFDTFYH